MTKVPDESWRTSSFSAEQTDCVQVNGTLTKLRDSKNPDGGMLTVNVEAFVSVVKAEHFGR